MATEKVTRKTLDDPDQRRLVEEALSELDFSGLLIRGEQQLMEEIAPVYARALFEVAEEQGKLDELREQLGQFADALQRNRDLRLFFFSPYFSTAEKQQALRSLLDGADDAFVNFLKLLIEKHRMPVIFRIRREYERLWEQENRVLAVQVTSAIELDEATIESIGESIGESTSRKVTLTTRGRPGHPRRDRPARRQLDPRRLDPQPTGTTTQAGRAVAGLSHEHEASQGADQTAMQINPDEITSILKSRIEGLDAGERS